MRLGYMPEAGYGHSCDGVLYRLKRYPATLLLYALGISALQAGEKGIPLLSLLLSTELQQEGQSDKKAVEVLPPFLLLRGNQQISKLLDGMEGLWFPFNEWLLRLLRPVFQSSCASQQGFQDVFDRLEILIAINFCSNNPEGRGDTAVVPFGLFARSDMFEPVKRLSPHVQALGSVLDGEGKGSVYITHALLGKSVDEARGNMDWLKNRVAGIQWY